MLLLGGGTGLAPLKSILRHVIENGLRPRDDPLLGRAQPSAICMRTRRSRTWRSARANFRYVPVLSEPAPGWAGRRGWVHEAALGDLAQPAASRGVCQRAAGHDRGGAARVRAARRPTDAAVFRFLRLCAGFARAPADDGRHQVLIFGRLAPAAAGPDSPRSRRLCATRAPGTTQCARSKSPRSAGVAIASRLRGDLDAGRCDHVNRAGGEMRLQRRQFVLGWDWRARAGTHRRPSLARRGARAPAAADPGRSRP